ncbi:MAG: alanine racemase [Lachnospiraceae bacterium]|nr:alanine racemase [Lachnospiraceae bacterium]
MEIKIAPRKATDRGGYACMPLKQNVPKGKHNWELTSCPRCGRECWRQPQIVCAEAQGAVAVCTECALREGAQQG